MSLIDLILEQKLIVISIVAALIPLLVAVVLMLRKRLRLVRKQRAIQRAEQARQAAILAELKRVDEAVASPVTREVAVEGVAGQIVQAPASPQPPSGGAAPVPSETSQAQKPEQEQPAGVMQSLLSSVFGDGAVDDRREALLHHTEAIDMTELAAFCSSVAHQLHTRAEQRGA